MSLYSPNQPSINARMIKILWRQQQELVKKSPDCVIPIINNEDPIDIQADIEGPQGTPYENGIFRVKLFIPSEFPQIAPKGYFLTKIFHPNVSEKGEICVNTLKRDWNPKQWSLYNLFEVIKCLLIVPFPQSSLNEEAGKMFMDNYDEYFRVAKMLTGIHAKKKSEEKIDEKNSNKDNNITEKKEQIEDDVDMMNNNNNSEKIENKTDNKKNIEIIKMDSSKNVVKNKMDLSFIKESFNSDNSCSLFYNQNNNPLNNIRGLNDNILDNGEISKSRTFKFGERKNFNFLNLNSEESFTSQIFHNNLKIYDRMSSISSINSSSSVNSNLDIRGVSTFKEKPNLGHLPLLSINSLKIKNEGNRYSFFRSKTLNLGNSNNITKKNNKDEINKWIMRI